MVYLREPKEDNGNTKIYGACTYLQYATLSPLLENILFNYRDPLKHSVYEYRDSGLTVIREFPVFPVYTVTGKKESPAPVHTQMDRDGTMDAMRDKKHFISKSERKKIARQKAIYIQKMKNKEWE